jgi:hypothetical protein
VPWQLRLYATVPWQRRLYATAPWQRRLYATARLDRPPGASPWADLASHQMVTLFFAVIISGALPLHPCPRLRWLADAPGLAFGVAPLAFLHTFSSVWCHPSGLISSLVLWILWAEDPLTAQLRSAAT